MFLITAQLFETFSRHLPFLLFLLFYFSFLHLLLLFYISPTSFFFFPFASSSASLHFIFLFFFFVFLLFFSILFLFLPPPTSSAPPLSTEVSVFCSPVAQLKPGFGKIISPSMRIQPLTFDHRGGSASERWWGGGASLTLSPKSLILRPELQSAALHVQSCYTPAYAPPSAPFSLTLPFSAATNGGGEGPARSGC